MTRSVVYRTFVLSRPLGGANHPMEIDPLLFHRPATVRDACILGHQLGDDARFLAGGTDLLVDLKQQRVRCQHVIALDSLDELRQINIAEGCVRIGAMTTLDKVANSEHVRAHLPALSEAMLQMAAVQIRARATLGGNFCAAVPCADSPPVCMVYEATLRLVSPTGERQIPAQAFFRGPRVSVLQPGELLAEVILPIPPLGTGAAYARFSKRRFMSLAVAAVAASVRLDNGRISSARVAMTSVAPTPFLARETAKLLEGHEPTPALVENAAKTAASEARPISDMRGSDTFRRDLVEVLARRALAAAIERAEQNAATV